MESVLHSSAVRTSRVLSSYQQQKQPQFDLHKPLVETWAVHKYSFHPLEGFVVFMLCLHRVSRNTRWDSDVGSSPGQRSWSCSTDQANPTCEPGNEEKMWCFRKINETPIVSCSLNSWHLFLSTLIQTETSLQLFNSSGRHSLSSDSQFVCLFSLLQILFWRRNISLPRPRSSSSCIDRRWEERERAAEGQAHILRGHCGEECHWIWVFFHAPGSFVCRLRKSIVRADTMRKEASLEPLSAGASAALEPLKRAEWSSAIGSSRPEPETMPLGNFEEQQQLKMQLHFINYAFALLSCSFFSGRTEWGSGMLKFNRFGGRRTDYSEKQHMQMILWMLLLLEREREFVLGCFTELQTQKGLDLQNRLMLCL